MYQHVIAVDQGKSGTRVQHFHGGEPRGIEIYDGFSLRSGSKPIPELLDSLSAIVRSASRTLLGEREAQEDEWALAIGATGAPSTLAELDHVASALHETIGCAGVRVCEDVIGAHVTAFGFEPGVVMSAGTGAVALYADGETLRKADGWGPRLGDSGSGFWIGRAGLRAGIAASEGRGPSTGLATTARAYLGELGPETARVVETTADLVGLMTGFVPRVVRCADSDDDVAVRILAKAGSLLADTAVSAVPESISPVNVAGTGRLFRSAQVIDSFAQALRTRGFELAGTYDSVLAGASRLFEVPPGHVFTDHIGSVQ